MIVVAKYKEDITWVKDLKYPYIIYDKNKDIPNVGREAETYLRFILENYDNLPDYTVFLQGKPFDHLTIGSVEFINEQIELSNDSKKTVPLNYLHRENHNHYTRTKESYNTLFNNEIPAKFDFPPGAQFIVPKECILCRPYKYYDEIRKTMVEINNTEAKMDNCLVCPWTIERMWLYIFDLSIPHRDIIYKDLF
jgi:hypothetical protein